MITNCITLVLATLFCLAAWFCIRYVPSAAARQAEVARFEAMPVQLDWKPTALSLIKNRQEMAHASGVTLMLIVGAFATVAVISTFSLLSLRRLARSSGDEQHA